MKRTHSLVGIAAVLAVAACAVSQPSGSQPWHDPAGSGGRNAVQPSADDDADGDEGDEVRICADEIPQTIRASAIAALPGLVISDAEIEEDGTIYCVHGTVDGKSREVEVTAADAKATVEPEDEDERATRATTTDRSRSGGVFSPTAPKGRTAPRRAALRRLHRRAAIRA